jgi:hypothetical protein
MQYTNIGLTQNMMILQYVQKEVVVKLYMRRDQEASDNVYWLIGKNDMTKKRTWYE